MGGWRLEAFKMSMYMAFPVGIYYWFNRPETFEEWTRTTRALVFPHENPEELKRKSDDVAELQRQRSEILEKRMQMKYESKT